MASKNGDTVFDLVTDSFHRTVVEFGNSKGVSLPKEYREDQDIEVGDDVVMKENHEKGVLELHFE